ncbi:hypothetical protein [Rubritalea sp.]|uniref:hypothetical protein n=1 Tax=Rubritalea sp. TaxID=2109375 RepID=UPI003EF98965
MKISQKLSQLLALSCALVVTVPLALKAEDKATAATETVSKKVQYLFVHNAKDVSFADGKMTLKGIDANTVFFSDRPDRIAGQITTADFTKNWGNGADSFEADNPNATIAIFSEEEPTDIVVELSNPVLAEDSLTYDIKVLEGEIPKATGECSLFIDIIGRPLTPVSYAGVARRTARRVVRYR